MPSKCTSYMPQKRTIVIWKSEKPRCFKRVNKTQLPVDDCKHHKGEQQNESTKPLYSPYELDATLKI